MTDDERIGKYRIIKELARSAAGDFVYLSHDEELQRPVAIQIFNTLASSKKTERLFWGDAASLVNLHHPHIVPIYEIGHTEDGKPFVVSKFIEGVTLREKFQDERPSFDESAVLLASVAETLHFAHQHGVIHGNLNLGQIFIERDTKAIYVTDFVRSNRTRTDELGTIVGNPSYMSPEQVQGDTHTLDGRTDIYSLGVIFYELLTGGRPFQGSNALELINQILSAEPMPPRKRNKAIPLRLERICLKALSKRPPERYSTAAELAAELRHWKTASIWDWVPRTK